MKLLHSSLCCRSCKARLNVLWESLSSLACERDYGMYSYLSSESPPTEFFSASHYHTYLITQKKARGDHCKIFSGRRSIDATLHSSMTDVQEILISLCHHHFYDDATAIFDNLMSTTMLQPDSRATINL